VDDAVAVYACFAFLIIVALPAVALVVALVAKSQAVQAMRRSEELAGKVASLQERLAQLYQRLLRIERQLGLAPEETPQAKEALAKSQEAAEWKRRVTTIAEEGAPEAKPGVPAPTLPAAAPRPPALAVETLPAPPSGLAPSALGAGATPAQPTVGAGLTKPLPAPPQAPPAAGPPMPFEGFPAAPQAPAATPPAAALPPEPAPPPVPAAAPPPPKAPPEAVPKPPPPPRLPVPPQPPVLDTEGGWERKLGIYIPVWIGGLALVLGGIFLVKYSIEHGWLGPAARVALLTLFGAALLVTGELIRKKTPAAGQGASAGGIGCLYAAFLAGTVLYHVIAPWAGFGLIALVTATAVALSLRQGIVVAVLGLVGGFLSPYLIELPTTSPIHVFAYLLLLQGGLIVVTRKRQWNALAGLTLVMGIFAALQRIGAGKAVEADAPWIGLFVLLSTAAFVYAAKKWKDTHALDLGPEVQGAVPVNALLGYVALGGAFLSLAVLAVKTKFGLMEWGFFGVLALASIVLGRLDPLYSKLPWVGFAVTALLAAGWIVQSKPEERLDIFIVAAGIGVLYGLGAYIAHQASTSPASWATLSAAGGLAGFGLAWWADKSHGDYLIPHWGYISLGLAVPYLIASIVGALPARRKQYGDAALAAFCVAVTAFVSFSVPLELERHWITVAWALEAAALAWLLMKLRVRVLGYLGCLVAIGVVIRLLMNPEILKYPLGPVPVLNWILYGYGIPALALALAAYCYGRSGWQTASGAHAWASGGLTFALLTLEVRHGFHPAGIAGSMPKVVEWATYSHLWILTGLLLIGAYLKWRKNVVGYIGLAFFAVAALKIALFDLLVANPLWNLDAMGDALVLNWLLYVYALPAVGFAIGAWLLSEADLPGPAGAASWAAGLLGLVLVALEVRQGFHGADLTKGGPTLVEWATYTVAWLAAGLLLLLAYRKWGRPVLLHLGVAFFAVSSFKIVIVDILAASPLFNDHSVGSWYIVNWLLYVYGVPALLLALFKPVLEGFDDESAKSGAPFKALSLLVLFVLVSTEVRQFFHGEFLDKGDFSIVETATYDHAWMFLSAVFLLAWGWRKDPVLLWGGRAMYTLALLKLVLVEVLFCNPYFWHTEVGDTPVFNWLLYIYAVPIVLLVLLSRIPGGEGWSEVTAPVSFHGGLVLGVVLLTLEVRQFFHHEGFIDKSLGAPGQLENYAYSAAWLLFSLLLLGVGLAKGMKGPRVAALVVMLLAVFKVFIYDLRHLHDLYRAASFVGLGLCLILIAFLYQRFVYKEVARG